MTYKTIQEFPTYEINEQGDVRNIKTKRTKYINKGHEKVYYLIQFKADKKTYTRKIHRLVAEYFLGKPSLELEDECSKIHPFKPVVNHIDHDKTNNHFSNLEWCSMQHNSDEAYLHGMVPALKGELNGRAILTEEDVHEMCRLFEKGGITVEGMGFMFNISRSQASKIRAGLSWVHVWEQYNIVVKRRKK